jgi:hypothetical protein
MTSGMNIVELDACPAYPVVKTGDHHSTGGHHCKGKREGRAQLPENVNGSRVRGFEAASPGDSGADEMRRDSFQGNLSYWK